VGKVVEAEDWEVSKYMSLDATRSLGLARGRTHPKIAYLGRHSALANCSKQCQCLVLHCQASTRHYLQQ
jgi:hypothetical protein